MIGFLFPLGAKRALDYASFFRGRSPDLATLKGDQGAVFGECYMCAVREDWDGLTGHLNSLATLEGCFRDTLLTLS